MLRLDRLRRHYFRLRSGKRVVIILVAITGILLIFSYVVQPHNFTSQRFYNIEGIIEDITRKGSNRKETSFASHSGIESSTNTDPISFEDVDANANTFITIGGSEDDIVTTTEHEGNEPEYKDQESDKDQLFEPFSEQFLQSFQSNNSTSEGHDHDSVNSTFKNNLFTFFCKNVRVRRAQKRNKNLIVYENFIASNHNMQCHESIAYSTHGDYRYLDNLIPLVDRWNGPVSVAIYSPGTDLRKTLKIISFLRDCVNFYKIRKFITFHIFFEMVYAIPLPGQSHWQWLDSMYEEEAWKNCSEIPNPKNLRTEPTFRMQKKLLYPVNVARNIARTAVTTHFVLASDIELYPSIKFMPSFFKMLHDQHKHDKTVIMPARQVYVLPVFEVKRWVIPPKTKAELIPLLKTGDAITFHNFICKECHIIPKFDEWAKKPKFPTILKVFHSAKRTPPHNLWEPIYIGTKYEPLYDERLSWEGLRDKMTQGYILCALDYNFLILDNAFLIHRPGIKRLAHKITKTVLRQDRLINFKIKVEFFRRFGKQSGCSL